MLHKQKSFGQFLFACMLLSLVSCAPQINYMGNSYSPTQNVDIFFDENDITKEYRVMGVVKNEGSGFLENDDLESIQNAMIEKAKAVGADAILIIGSYTEKENTEYTDIDKDKDGATATTYKNSSKIVEAKFLKYK